MDWKSIISKLKSGTEKRKREQWMALFAAGVLILLFASSSPGKQTLPASAAAQSEIEEGVRKNYNKNEKGMGEETFDLAAYEKQLEERVQQLLRTVEGVGKADVMIILKSSGETIIHEDQKRNRSSSEEADSAGGTRKTVNEEVSNSTVFVENGSEKKPIVEKELCPTVEGIVISAQGGGSALVKTEISEAMEALFHIPAHKIKVLKRVD